MKKHTGFTIIELMITLVIVGILVAVGLPAMKSFTQRNQLVAGANELISALNVARSEAIKNNISVSICASSTGTSCSNSGKWHDGWIVFTDSNENQDGASGPCSLATINRCLLRVHDGFTGNDFTITGLDANVATINSFTFTARGMPEASNGAPQSGTFNLCSLNSSGTTIDSRAVVLSLSGRVRVSDNPAVITQCP